MISRTKVAKVIYNLIRDIERNTCTHEDTHRGGVIWEICDMCGKKWADDEGGKPEYKEKECVTEGYKILDQLDLEPLNLGDNQWVKFCNKPPSCGVTVLIFDGRFTTGHYLSSGDVYARGEFHPWEKASKWYWMELPSEPIEKATPKKVYHKPEIIQKVYHKPEIIQRGIIQG